MEKLTKTNLFPYILLGVTRESTDEEIKSAYQEKISIYSPDRHPEHFKKIRDVYENIKTEENRVKYELFHKDELLPSDLLWLLLLSKVGMSMNLQLFEKYFTNYIDENRPSN